MTDAKQIIADEFIRGYQRGEAFEASAWRAAAALRAHPEAVRDLLPPGSTELRLHLASHHALANALDDALTPDDLHDIHEHEHDGPCTIRNHPREARDWTGTKAAEVVAESVYEDRILAPGEIAVPVELARHWLITACPPFGYAETAMALFGRLDAATSEQPS